MGRYVLEHSLIKIFIEPNDLGDASLNEYLAFEQARVSSRLMKEISKILHNIDKERFLTRDDILNDKDILGGDCSHRFVFSSTYRSDEYIECLKMLEEMAGAVQKIQLKFDKDLAIIVGLARLKEVLEKYRQFKEGIK